MRAPKFRMAIPILLTAVCLEAQWQTGCTLSES